MTWSTDPALLLSLPCNALVSGHLLDASRHAIHPTLPAALEIKVDPAMGWALLFPPQSPGLRTILPRLPDEAFTLAFWICPEVADQSATILRILPPAGIPDTALPVLGVQLAGGKLQFSVGHLDAGTVDQALAPARWSHVALAWSGLVKTLQAFVDGKPVPLSFPGLTAAAAAAAPVAGLLNPPQVAPVLVIGAGADGSLPFSGRMARLQLFQRALPAEYIGEIVYEETNHAVPPFDVDQPLYFRLADADGIPAIAIVEKASQGRSLHLVLGNQGLLAIEFLPAKTKKGKKDRLSELKPTFEDHHLEFVFRPGTLSLQDAVRIAPSDPDWSLQWEPNAGDGSLSLLLKRPAGLILPPGGVLTISLAHVKAQALGGSRLTQVALRYRYLQHLGGDTKLTGASVAPLEVVNKRGLAEAPFAAGFLGSNTVLNDGKARNTLALYLGNPSFKPLRLRSGDPLAIPRLFISFDCEADAPMALGHVDEVSAIEIAPTAQGWTIHREEQGLEPVWTLLPPPGLEEIAENAWFNFTLYPIVTRAPSGFTALRLRYQNIEGHRDGEIVLPIEKGPRFYRQQPLLPAPGVPRTVHAFADSVVIGRNQALIRADEIPHDPPASPSFPEENSLRVEGKVGISLDDRNPRHALHVGGDYYGLGHVYLHAYEGDGNDGTAYLQARDDKGTSRLSLQLRTQDTRGIRDHLRLRDDGSSKFAGSVSDRNGLIIPIGTIVMWSNFRGAGIPAGWVLCDGREVTIPADVDKSADARDPALAPGKFRTPDLRDRFIVGSGANYAVGAIGGLQEISLTVPQMPAHEHSAETERAGKHSHTMNASDSGDAWPHGKRGDSRNTGGIIPTSEEGEHIHKVNIGLTGGGQPHENRPPYYSLAFIIKIE